MSALNPLVHGQAPAWAVAWGVDEHGVYADLAVDRVLQRMRWIPRGRFQMGSPQQEEGHLDDEGPQHPVRISRGFWLGDTPVTQALWVALMQDNPSHFAGTSGEPTMQRPVEQVNHVQAAAFCQALNTRLPGHDRFRLPTEAEWEYACRAGTTAATWEREVWGRSDLDAIAWSVRNSGGSTQPVACKAPNPWGLHDVLGNVYEWCWDDGRDYDRTAQQNPVGPRGTASRRVGRGGSWFNTARYCRAAFRFWFHPSNQWINLGFRLARGSAPSRGAEQQAEPAQAGESR